MMHDGCGPVNVIWPAFSNLYGFITHVHTVARLQAS